MFKKKETKFVENIDTLIGAHTTFEGNIESDGSIRIEGKVKGDIFSDGDVIIGSTAVIHGNIKAANIRLSGDVEGNIFADGLLHILSCARLMGNIQVKSFVTDEGGLFQGKCSMIETPAAVSPEFT